jgi:hypothetical protein
MLITMRITAQKTIMKRIKIQLMIVEINRILPNGILLMEILPIINGILGNNNPKIHQNQSLTKGTIEKQISFGTLRCLNVWEKLKIN